jgi:hypothetical protein
VEDFVGGHASFSNCPLIPSTRASAPGAEILRVAGRLYRPSRTGHRAPV